MQRGFLLCLIAVALAIPVAVQADQLDGMKIPLKGKQGVFTPGLIRGYGEHQVIPFKTNIDPVDLEDARLRAQAEGSCGEYLISLMIPTFSDHAPPRDSEANAMSELLFGVPVGGAYPHPMAGDYDNYKDLPSEEAPASRFLPKGGSFVFGVVAYNPTHGSPEASKTAGAICLVENRFAVGHPTFPNGVTGLVYDVHFDYVPPTPKGKGKKNPPLPACTIQFGARLAISGIEAIVPTTHLDHGTVVPGACSFHPGPGMLHVAYEVQHPTGRATVPIVCTFPQDKKDKYLIQICGVKWCDSDVDHMYDMGDQPLPGVIIELRDGSCGGMVLDSATTDARGMYCLQTYADDGADLALYVVEDSTGPGGSLDAYYWAQTTPQTDCWCEPIAEDIFPVGTGVFCEFLNNITGDERLPGRNFGNLKFGDVGERTPGFWCSQVHRELYDQGGSQPCNYLIESCSGSLLNRILEAVRLWGEICPAKADIFEQVPLVDGPVDTYEDAMYILCPQDGSAEHFQLQRHLLALMLNVADCPCEGEPCGKVGSPLCMDQPIALHGYKATVGDALAGVCDGTVGKDVIAAINENRITILENCGF